MQQSILSNRLSTIASEIANLHNFVYYLTGTSLSQVSSLIYTNKRLEKTLLLNDITLANFESILSKAHLIKYQKGKHIYREGENENGFYILIKGSVYFSHKVDALKDNSLKKINEIKELLIKQFNISLKDIEEAKLIRNTNIKKQISKSLSLSVKIRVHHKSKRISSVANIVEKNLFALYENGKNKENNFYLFGDLSFLHHECLYENAVKQGVNIVSAICNEDDTFILHFDEYALNELNSFILKSTKNKIHFIKKHFSSICLLGKASILNLYNKVQFFHPKKRSKIIYEQNNIFLIYKGLCGNQTNGNNIIFDSGDFLFLDYLCNNESNHSQINIFAITNDVIIIKIGLSLIPKTIYKDLLCNLKFINQKQIEIRAKFTKGQSKLLSFSLWSKKDNHSDISLIFKRDICKTPLWNKPKQTIKLSKRIILPTPPKIKLIQSFGSPTITMKPSKETSSIVSLSTSKSTYTHSSTFYDPKIKRKCKPFTFNSDSSIDYMFLANTKQYPFSFAPNNHFNLLNLMTLSGKREKEDWKSMSLEEKIMDNVKGWKKTIKTKNKLFRTNNFNIALIQKFNS